MRFVWIAALLTLASACGSGEPAAEGGGLDGAAPASSTLADVTATFEPTLGAPICTTVGAGCTSGTLLVGRGTYVTAPEANAPNVIGGACADSSANGLPMVDAISVYTLDGSTLAENKLVQIDVDARGPVGMVLGVNLFISTDPLAPGSFRKAGYVRLLASGRASFQLLLGFGAEQAVRAEVYYEGASVTTSCQVTGPRGDTDDLALTVAPGTPDTTPPTAAIVAPVDGADVSGAVPVTVTATDDVFLSRIVLYVDGAVYRTVNATVGVTSYGLTWYSTAAPAGAHVLTAVAFDAAGNSTTSSPVTVTTPDQAPITVAITSPVDGARVRNSVSIAAATTGAVVGVDFFVDGVLLATDTAAPYAAIWNAKAASRGSHVITASASGVAGQTATASVTVTR